MASLTIKTPRLELVASTVESLIAASSAAELSKFLGCEVDGSWPPEALVDALQYFIDLSKQVNEPGWMPWWWIKKDHGKSHLVGNGGFLGAPHECGFTEIGFEVLPAFRRQGVATEAVAHLVAWAFESVSVGFIEGNTESDNIPAIKLLSGLGFTHSEEEDGIVRMVITRDSFKAELQ